MPSMTLVRLVRPLRFFLRRLKRGVLSNPTVRAMRDEFNNDFEFTYLATHEAMIADAVRMDAYHAAIRRNITAGSTVIDLGTGTGILAMLAAQQNPKVVHAIDYSNLISLAERVASANRFTNIRFHQVDSHRFSLDERVDVILHEQIGSALLDEGMVEKTLDLKKRLLKKTGKILPGKFELFLQPVCVKDEFRVPYLWEHSIHGIDFSSLKDSPYAEKYKLGAYDSATSPQGGIDYFLCDPSPVLAFDLNEISDPGEIPDTITVTRTVSRSGRLDGFCLYFRVIFDAETEFDNSPFSPRTSWGGVLYRLESRQVQAGDRLSYTLEMHDPLQSDAWMVRLHEQDRPA